MNVGVNMLEKLGYTVLAAKNGTEAVDIFEANKDKIKMVVLDIIMPGMGGGEVYDKIKANSSGCESPALQADTVWTVRQLSF